MKAPSDQTKTENGIWPTDGEPMPPSEDDASSREWPKISVVTPSYNQGRYIESTIRSVLLQNYPNLEYVIVDGGSTDDTLSIIEKYKPWLSVVISEPDDGQYNAITKGFARTEGDIMLWLNSDDMLFPQALLTLAKIFGVSSEIEWVTGIPAYWSEDGINHQIMTQLPFNRTLMRMGCYEGRAIHWLMQECTAWSRKLWDRSGAYMKEDLQYAADFELWLRFSEHAQLYTVAALLGGNRQQPHQKTNAVEPYNQEVDKILANQGIGTRAFNWFCRYKMIKKIIRSYLMVRKDPYRIKYSATANRWSL
jgi:glycosyltransferase involved in cell wall biosynthesis